MSIIANKSDTQNLLLIGLGPHAQKVYLPWFIDNGGDNNASIKAVVELDNNTKSVERYLNNLNQNDIKVIGTKAFSGDELPVSLKNTLNDILITNHIKAVIIASEPSTHKPYALWALANGLHILMDKPISARADSLSDIKQAEKIKYDYDDLVSAYQRALIQDPGLTFTISAQRRYHAGFTKVKEYITDVLEKTNCPITSIQSSHADGQWRLPHEFIDIAYHGFKEGYGKVSHSGYHFFDLMNQLIGVGSPPDKMPDHAEVFSVLTTPQDYLQQLTVADYDRIFEGYSRENSQADLERSVTNYGEVDAFSLINLSREGKSAITIQLSLLHNSFSRRHWEESHSDLYKKNGRVKHEHHTIQQGPFQTIQIHSYQLGTDATNNTTTDYEIGGRNHLDINVFRNSDIVGGKPLTQFSVNDIFDNPDSFDLSTKLIKSKMIEEFVDYINGKIKKSELRSDLLTHRNAVYLMSSVYLSNIARRKGVNPISSFLWA